MPFSRGMERPGDRRRFPGYARLRNVELVVVDGPDDLSALDLVVLSSNADMTLWGRRRFGVPYVVDVPDAVMVEAAGVRPALRGVAKWLVGASRRPVLDHRRALVGVLEGAEAVVCSTPEQRSLLEAHCGKVHAVLDLHGEVGSHPPVEDADPEVFDVVWEGMVATLPALRQLLPGLRAMAADREVRVHVVTDRRHPRYMERFAAGDTSRLMADWDVPVALYQWDNRTMPVIARTCDVAVVPVDLSDPQARAKPENRMRIFWRLGLPVLASDTPSHRRAIEAAGIPPDVLCRDEDDWARALRGYADDPVARGRVARLGNEASRTTYGDEAIVAGWDAVMADVGVVVP